MFFLKKAVNFERKIYAMCIIRNLTLLFCFVCLVSCGKGSSSSEEEVKLSPTPLAHADSIYSFVEKQVRFGPRVPNSEAHHKAAQWFRAKFESYGAGVMMQTFKDEVYDGTGVELTNVIASFYPKKKKRILLAAHWDTRPFSDRDPEDKYAAMDGANDGASGVGVLLEVARVLSTGRPPDVGIDIILFDGEDWGEHNEVSEKQPPEGKDSWWCLGSQYWSRHKHKHNYTAYYGILLDMVGGTGASFRYDNVSQENAARILDKVWNIAHQIGYSSMFIKQSGFSGIIDDHVYVNREGRIPMINIIDYRDGNSGFSPVWHTQNDTMENIDKKTLLAVATVLLTVLYNE